MLIKALRIRPRVHNRDVHWLADLFRLRLAGGDDAMRFFQGDHDFRSSRPTRNFNLREPIELLGLVEDIGGTGRQDTMLRKSEEAGLVVTLFDKREGGAPRHPEKAHRPDTPVQRKPAWISRVKAPGSRAYANTAEIIRTNRSAYGLRRSGLPQHRRVLGEKARDHDDHGRHLHARLRLLQCKDGASRRTRRQGAGKCGERGCERLALSMWWSRPWTGTIWRTAGQGISRRRIRAIRAAAPPTTIEVLTPDFLKKGRRRARNGDCGEPDVFNHNLETVPSLYLTIRPGARYFHSLRLLQRAKELDRTMFTKSGIMAGLGEKRNEVLQLMDDLRSADVDFAHHRPIPSAHAKARRR